VEYLSGRGWQVATRPRRELFADYGRTFPEDDGLAALPQHRVGGRDAAMRISAAYEGESWLWVGRLPSSRNLW
jgi:hypothetical protein